MTIDEMRNRIEAIDGELAEVRTAADDPDANVSELEARTESLTEERAGLVAEIETAERAAAEERAAVEEVIKGAGKIVEEREEVHKVEVRNTPEYIEAFARYTKTGDDTECRALLTENVTGGKVAVPTFVAEIVAERLKESKILNRVRRMNAAGNVEVGFEISAPAATVHTEGGAAQAEEALTLGIVKLVPKTYKKWVAISDEALDSMSGEAYLRYVYDEVARGIIKARENAVVAAILAAPATATATAPAVAKTGSAAGAITDFIDARALLSSAAEDLVIICTPAQYATYRGLQMSASYAVDPFDGLEVLFNDTVTAPIIGDLYGVMENLPKGDAVEFKFDDKTDMKSDLVNILGRQPAAIGVVGNNFFAKVSA